MGKGGAFDKAFEDIRLWGTSCGVRQPARARFVGPRGTYFVMKRLYGFGKEDLIAVKGT